MIFNPTNKRQDDTRRVDAIIRCDENDYDTLVDRQKMFLYAVQGLLQPGTVINMFYNKIFNNVGEEAKECNKLIQYYKEVYDISLNIKIKYTHNWYFDKIPGIE